MVGAPLRQPSSAYARVFTAFAAGAFLLVTGVIGLDVSYMRGFFEGTKWVPGPVWWQIALGSGLLLLGVYWSRRLGAPRWTSSPTPPARVIKDVGAGKSSGAVETELARHDLKPPQS
jgi:hypothetical protein